MVDLERNYLLSVCPGRRVGMRDEEGERRLGQDGGGGGGVFLGGGDRVRTSRSYLGHPGAT